VEYNPRGSDQFRAAHTGGQELKEKRPALGRGLAALLPATAAGAPGGGLLACPIDRIDAPDSQPRRRFDADAIEGLAASIRESGVLQPLLVAREGTRYRLIAGERRLRAARLAGLASVPVLVRQATEEGAFLLALVENVQREDLNPVEQAHAFRRLVEDFGLTQEEVARRVGKQRSTVANSLRLLKLAPPVLAAVEDGRVAEGSARALLPLQPGEQVEALARVVGDSMNTRQVEALVKERRRGKGRETQPADGEPGMAGYFEDARARIESALDLPVTVTYKGNRGRLSIAFGSLAAFRRLCDALLDGAPREP